MTKKKTVTFEDIKFGDKIRVTKTYKKGSVEILEGSAFFLSSRSIGTEDRTVLLTNLKPQDENSYLLSVEVEILDRPKMPFKVGTVISASLKNGTGGNFVRVEQAGDDDELVWLELAGIGDNYITEDEIKEWQELKLVTVDAKVSYE